MKYPLLLIGLVAAATVSGGDLPNVRINVDFNVHEYSFKYTDYKATKIDVYAADIFADYLNENYRFLQYSRDVDSHYHLTFRLETNNHEPPDQCAEINLVGSLTRELPSADYSVIVTAQVSFRPLARCGGAFGDPDALLSELRSVLEEADPLWLSDLLAQVEILGPFEDPVLHGKGIVSLRQPEGEILVAITKWDLGMSTVSTLDFGFQMHAPDGVIVDWQRYSTGAIMIYAPGPPDPFDSGLLSSLEFAHPSKKKRFFSDTTKIRNLAVYMQRYVPEDPIVDMMTLQIGEGNYHKVLRLANNARAVGQHRIADYGYTAVVENSLDGDLVSQATSSWLQLRTDSGYLSRQTLQHLPATRASGVVTLLDILQFLDDPYDFDSPVWNDNLTKGIAPHLFLLSCDEAAQRIGMEGAAGCYETLLFGDFEQSDAAKTEAAIRLLRIRTTMSSSALYELDKIERYVTRRGLLRGDTHQRSRLANALRISDIVARNDPSIFDNWTSADWDLWLHVTDQDTELYYNWTRADFDYWIETGRQDPAAFLEWERSDWELWTQLRHNASASASQWEASEWLSWYWLQFGSTYLYSEPFAETLER